MFKRILLCLLIVLACKLPDDPPPADAGLLHSICQASKSSACTASYGSELATTNNATDAGGSEANSTTGWTNSSLATWDAAGTAQAGSYALNAIADAAGDHFYRDFSGLSAATMYKVSFYARHNGTGGNFTCSLAASHFSPTITLATLTSADTTYTQYTAYFHYIANVTQTIMCKSAAANGGIYLDNYSLKTATPCLGAELFTDGNAASKSNEANSIGNWTKYQATPTLESVTTDPQDGSYSIHFVAAANNDGFYIDMSAFMTVGKKYFVSWKQKHLGADASSCGLGGATPPPIVGPGAFPTTSAWTTPGIGITYATASHRYFGCKENGSNNNSEVLLDSMTIKEITAE